MARTFARRLEQVIGDVRSSGSRLVKVDIKYHKFVLDEENDGRVMMK